MSAWVALPIIPDPIIPPPPMDFRTSRSRKPPASPRAINAPLAANRPSAARRVMPVMDPQSPAPDDGRDCDCRVPLIPRRQGLLLLLRRLQIEYPGRPSHHPPRNRKAPVQECPDVMIASRAVRAGRCLSYLR